MFHDPLEDEQQAILAQLGLRSTPLGPQLSVADQTASSALAGARPPWAAGASMGPEAVPPSSFRGGVLQGEDFSRFQPYRPPNLATLLAALLIPGAGRVIGAVRGGRERTRLEGNRRFEMLAAERNRANLLATEAARRLREHQIERLSRRSEEIEKEKREAAARLTPAQKGAAEAESIITRENLLKQAGVKPDPFGAGERFNLTYEPDPSAPGKFRPTTQRTTILSSLSDDVRSDPDIKEFVTVRDNYQRVQEMAKQRTGQGDLAVIFAYMKVLDPTSVVREAEYTNAAQAVGKLPALSNVPRNWIQGDKLTEEGRIGFVAATQVLYDTKRQSYEQAAEFYRNKARSLGVDPSLVLRDFAAPRRLGAPADSGYRKVNGIRVRTR